MRRRVGVEDKSRFSIHDISLGEDLGMTMWAYDMAASCTI